MTADAGPCPGGSGWSCLGARSNVLLLETVAVAAFVSLMLGPAALEAGDEGSYIVAGGQMRVLGVAFNNVRDFKDSQAGQFRDHESLYQTRFRLYTVAESRDWKARAVWALEIGDITWGSGGGANSDDLACKGEAPETRFVVTPTGAGPVKVRVGTLGPDVRVGPGSGGCLGSDGVNVETKNLYIRFEVPGEPHARVRLGAAPVRFLPGARLPMFSADTFGLCACLDDRPLPADVVFDEFTNEDVFQIQLDWQDRVPGLDVQLTAGKASEGALPDADDVDLYMGRVGYLVKDDIYGALEAMVINQQGLPGANLGDTFWIGSSVRVETDWPAVLVPSGGRLYLGVTAVYGRRAVLADADATCGGPRSPCRESGFGVVGWAQRRTYDLIATAAGWYTSGDDDRNPRAPTNAPLVHNSHRLPIPLLEKSWGNPPLIGEWVLSTSWFGAPELGQSHFRDLSGTYGAGASIQQRLRMGGGYVQAGMGIGFVGASGAADVVPDAPQSGMSGGWGKFVVEIDAGFVYRFYYNPNFSFRGLAGFMAPERNDPAWAAGFVTQFDF